MAKKRDIEHFDPGATFPEGVSFEGIRAAILAGSEAPCDPLPPADPPKRTWNTEKGVWEIDGIEIPPDPTAASVEYTEKEVVLEEPSLQGLPTLGTPVPPMAAAAGLSVAMVFTGVCLAAFLGFAATFLWLL